MSETANQNETTKPAEGAPSASPSVAPDAAAAGTQKPSAAPSLPEGEMSFAEMFELAEKQAKEKKKATRVQRQKEPDGERELSAGQALEAKVVGFSHDSVFLDVGGKAEGVIDRSELLNEAGELTVKEGDRVEVRVISADGGTLKLGKVLAHQSMKNRDAVRQAYESGMPIEGKISGQNKGGLDVQIAGMRAFCPASQIDIRHVENPAELVGQKLSFKVTEFKDGGRNIVVSRRAVLMEGQKKAAEEALSKLSVGQRVKGRVTSVKDYGAFVDLGGVEGLVHVSEISHGRVVKPGDVLKPGQEVEVAILGIEDRKEREPREGREGRDRGGDRDPGKKISLSIKALESDPWEKAQSSLREGIKVRGRVQRIQPFGAFVELFPGVDGLIHVSNMSSERINDPRQLVKEGDEVEATVVSLDWEKRRIGLSLVKTPQELAGELHVGSVLEGTIDRIEGFGVFVKLPGGARGLVPVVETGTQRGADLKKEFTPGKKAKVSVLEVDPNSGKIRLSMKAVAEAEERAEYTSYMSTGGGGKSAGVGGGGGGGGSSGFGTLGDLLKKRDEKKKK
jgi:small subunit ribosomal protein S1